MNTEGLYKSSNIRGGDFSGTEELIWDTGWNMHFLNKKSIVFLEMPFICLILHRALYKRSIADYLRNFTLKLKQKTHKL